MVAKDNLPPPKVNQSNAGVVRCTNKKGNPLIVKEKKVLNKWKWNPGLFQSKEKSTDIEDKVQTSVELPTSLTSSIPHTSIASSSCLNL